MERHLHPRSTNLLFVKNPKAQQRWRLCCLWGPSRDVVGARRIIQQARHLETIWSSVGGIDCKTQLGSIAQRRPRGLVCEVGVGLVGCRSS